MIWNQQENHDTHCFFCLTKLTGFASKTKHKIKYADLKTVCTPVSYTADMFLPVCPTINEITQVPLRQFKVK